jgi:hypothetical protein
MDKMEGSKLFTTTAKKNSAFLDILPPSQLKTIEHLGKTHHQQR